MKKVLLYLLIMCLLSVLPSFSQSGKVYDNLSLPSKILNGDRKYAVYLPPDYETSKRSYPVLYLFHGGGVDQSLMNSVLSMEVISEPTGVLPSRQFWILFQCHFILTKIS